MMILDMHVHTTKPGPHSCLDPIVLLTEAKRMGLGGICMTEHECTWERFETKRLSEMYDFPVFRGIEVGTDYGHIAVFGLDRYIGGIHKLAVLRRVADEMGAFLIALHPFRRVFEPINGHGRKYQTVEEAASLPVFDFVDEIEVLNGASTDVENDFALQVCKLRGMTGTGGSDAHSIHGLAYYTTVFERDIVTEEDLLTELRAKRFRPATGFLAGELVFYGADDSDTMSFGSEAEVEGESRG